MLRFGVEQPFIQGVQSGPFVEHEVVAVLDLGEEQPVLAAVVLTLGFGEERSEVSQPLLTAGQQVLCR